MTTEPPTQPWPTPHQPPADPSQPAFMTSAPAAPRRKLGTGAIIGIVIGAILVGCCGLAGVGALFSDDEPKSTVAISASPTAAAALPSLVPTTAPTTTAPATSSPPTTTPAAPPTPTTVVMPNLVGMNAAVAQDKLQKLGLTNIQLGSQDEHDTFVILAANWTVTKQSHKKGTRVALDDLVVLTCTKQR